MRLSNRAKVLFLLFVVLGVYYPSLFGQVNSVDDYNMIQTLADEARTSWRGVFLPAAGNYYYRPLLWSTYIADKNLWDLSESFMHLENILLHALNTVLVFFLALRVFRREDERHLNLPFLSALLFALHPINTESVAWISGRTDPLATAFIISSAIFLLKGIQETRYRHYFVATFLLLLGCLCKEVAVFFLPAACFIVLCHKVDEADGGGKLLSREKLRQLGIITAPFAVCGMVYLCLRFSSSPSGVTSIFKMFIGRNGSLLNILRITLKVFGFYVKKLFFPLPLNFAIYQISNLYVWLGLAAALLLVVILVRKRGILAALTATVAILIFPAILVTLSRVAWTPLAERYLYLPAAFFAIVLVGSLQAFGNRVGKKSVPSLLVALILVPAGFSTVQRNMVWQNNVTLYSDTLQKSPNSPFIKNELALALAHEGRVVEAERQLESAKLQDPNKTNALPYINQAHLKIDSGDLVGARNVILSVLHDDTTADPAALRTLAKIDEKRLFQKNSPEVTRQIQREIATTHDKLYLKTKNPIDLYRSAQMALFLGDRKRAQSLFEKAAAEASGDAYFKAAARKLAEKLKR